MAKKDDILKIIEQYQPIKAKDIAAKMNYKTIWINSVLYSDDMKNIVKKDTKHRWSLIDKNELDIKKLKTIKNYFA